MIAYLRDVVALGFPVVVGLPIVVGLRPVESWLARIGMAFLLGSAASGIALTAVGIVGTPMRREVFAVLLLAWLAGWGWLLRRRFAGVRLHLKRALPAVHPVVALLAGLTLLNVATAALYAASTPIQISDVLTIWLPKVERLAQTHSLLALNHTTFPDYPPIWPLHLFLTRDLAGHASAIKLLPTLYLVSLLAVIFGYLASRATPLVAAATVWVLSAIPYLWFPYGVNDLMAEVPFMAVLVASAIGLVRYIERDDVRTLVGAVVLATAAALLRPEGIQHAVLIGILAAVVSWKRNRWNPVIAATAAGPLLAYASWEIAIRLAPHGARGYAVNPGRALAQITPDTFIAIGTYAIQWLANPFVFGPTIIAASLCIAGYRSWRATWPWLAIFALDLAAIGATYTIAPASNDQSLTWWLVTGFKRMLLHIVPLLFIAAAVAAAGILKAPAPTDGNLPVPSWEKGGVGRVRAGPIVMALSFLVAGVLTVAIPGASTMRAADVVPNGVVGLASPLGFGRYTAAGWVDDPGLAADSMLLRVPSSARGAVTYDLNNLGQRLPPNDEVVGRFTGVDATVGALASANATQVELAANDRVIASATSGTRGSVSIQAGIPPDARTLSLIADAGAGGSSVQSVWVRAVLHRGGAWPLVAGLLLLASLMAIAQRIRTLHHVPPSQGGRGKRVKASTALAALLLSAALVQQLDVLTNQAVPLWSEAAHKVVHQLRSS